MVDKDATDAPPKGLAPRLSAAQAVGARLGVDLDRRLLGLLNNATEVEAPEIVRCLEDAGIVAKALSLGWSDLLSLARAGTPTILLLKDGGAALLEGAAPDGSSVTLRNPQSHGSPAQAVDRQRLSGFWLDAGIVARSAQADEGSEIPFGPRWVRHAVLREGRLVRDIVLSSVVLGAMAIAPALIIKQIADRVILYQSTASLVLLTAMVVIVITFETCLTWVKNLMGAALGKRVDGHLSLLIMQRLLRLPLDYFEKNPVGETTSRLYGTTRVREFVTGPLVKAVVDVLTLVIILPVMFMISWPLTLFVLGLAAFVALIVVFFIPLLRRRSESLIAAERAKAITLIETVQGIRTVKALAIEPQRTEAWNRHSAAALRAANDHQLASNRMNTATHPFERLFNLGPLMFGSWLVLTNSSDLTIGALFGFVLLANRAAAPLAGLSQMVASLETLGQSVQEAASVLNQPPERTSAAVGARPVIDGHIAFEDVTFTYPLGLSPALKRVSFDVPAGTVLGLVGRSGSGKSTVTRLLQALNSGYTGLVKIDGVELREMDLQHLRRNLGVVLQDNFLFRGTIRDNILAGRPGISFERVIQAARLAGAEEFIERLPRGYDTFIEEGSPNLSGGQKQRLAIARAVVTDPPVLVFDEATSSLDPESEMIVNSNLRRLARGRTVVIVSHRLSSLVKADKIVVMERGEVAAQGSHADLLRESPIYRTLWTQQTQDINEGRNEPDRITAPAQ